MKDDERKNNDMTNSTGGDYSLAGYDLLTEDEDFVMYRHQGSGRTFRVWKSALPSRVVVGTNSSARGDDNDNNSQIDNSFNKTMSTVPSDQSQPQSQQQRYTGTYAEFIKDKQKAAKAAYLEMRHNLIERAVQERKKDIEFQTVTLRDGRRAVLPRRSNDAVVNLLADGSKYDQEY